MAKILLVGASGILGTAVATALSVDAELLPASRTRCTSGRHHRSGQHRCPLLEHRRGLPSWPRAVVLSRYGGRWQHCR